MVFQFSVSFEITSKSYESIGKPKSFPPGVLSKQFPIFLVPINKYLLRVIHDKTQEVYEEIAQITLLRTLIKFYFSNYLKLIG